MKENYVVISFKRTNNESVEEAGYVIFDDKLSDEDIEKIERRVYENTLFADTFQRFINVIETVLHELKMMFLPGTVTE